MICFSSMLVFAVFRSWLRTANTINGQNGQKRDIKFAMNCFFMNSTFLLLNTPLSVISFFPQNNYDDSFFMIATYIFILSYGINFYIIFACNSLFRRKFYKILCGKQPKFYSLKVAKRQKRKKTNEINLIQMELLNE